LILIEVIGRAGRLGPEILVKVAVEAPEVVLKSFGFRLNQTCPSVVPT
jgi:hypothetical protein